MTEFGFIAMDGFLALVLLFDIGLGYFLGHRYEKMAQQMPTPQDRQTMLSRARQMRFNLTILSPIILVVLYFFFLRPSAV